MLKRAGPVLLLLLACTAAGVLAASVLADTPPPPATTDTTTTVTTTTAATTVPPGVTLGGVPIGGLAPDAAVAAVEQAFERPVELHLRGTKISIAPDLLGLSLSADSAVAKALTARPNTALALRATASKQLVNAFVGRLADRFDRKPVDSRLYLRGFQPVVTKSVVGRRVDSASTVRRVTPHLMHGTREDGSIGYSLSHGCIRMHIPEAEWLFNHVDIGTPVFIVAR